MPVGTMFDARSCAYSCVRSKECAFPDKAPDDAVLERAMSAGAEEGLSALSAQLQQEAALALELTKHNFRAPRAKTKEKAEA